MDITHGDELQCHVINIDLEKRVFYGHVDAEVIEGVIRRKSKKKKKIKEVGCFFKHSKTSSENNYFTFLCCRLLFLYC